MASRCHQRDQDRENHRPDKNRNPVVHEDRATEPDDRDPGEGGEVVDGVHGGLASDHGTKDKHDRAAEYRPSDELEAVANRLGLDDRSGWWLGLRGGTGAASQEQPSEWNQKAFPIYLPSRSQPWITGVGIVSE